MRCTELLADDDAVSPVIGVVLMVAITVLLATVVGVFVLDSGPSSEQMPQTTFGVEENPNSDDKQGTLVLTMRGGDRVDVSDLEAIGGNEISNVRIKNSDKTLQAGDSIMIEINEAAEPDNEIMLRWSPPGGEESRILFEHTLSTNWNN